MLPSSMPKPVRMGLQVLALLLGALPGCQRGDKHPVELQPTTPEAAPSQPPVLTPPSESERKQLLALDEICPPPILPAATEPRVPLSAESEAQLAKAQSLFREERLTEAAQTLEAALRNDSGNPRLHLALAKVALSQKIPERARAHAGQALQSNPRDAHAYYLLGRLAIDAGQYEEALARFRAGLAALEVEQGDKALKPLLHFQLAQVLEREGYAQAALQQYELYSHSDPAGTEVAETEPAAELRSLRMSAGSSAAVQRSRLLQALGRKPEALNALASLMNTPAETPAIRAQYAELLAEVGDPDQAVAEALALAERDPSFAELLIKLHRQRGSTAQLASDLEHLAALHPDHERLANAFVDALIASAGPSAAAERLRTLSASWSPDSPLRWRVGELLYFDLNRPDEAFDVAAEAITLGADRGVVKDQLKRWFSRRMGNPIALAQPVNPTPAKLLVLGTQSELQGDARRAQELFQASVERDKHFLAGMLELAESHQRCYEWEKMLEVVEAFESEGPPDGRVKWLEGVALAGLDRTEEAIASLNEAVGLRRTDPQIRRSLADIYQKSGRSDLALQQYQAALENDPLDEESREAIFWLYIGEGEYTRADEQLQLLRRNGAAASRVARCLAHLERDPRQPDWNRFRATLEAAMDPSNPDSDSLHHIGLSYLRQGDLEPARQAFERVLELDPSKDEALAQLAMVHGRELRFEESEHRYRELLRRYPNRIATLTLLAHNLLTQQKFDEVVETANTVLQRKDLDADSKATFRTFVSEALSASGHEDKFIEHFRRWRRADPNDPSLYEFLVNVSPDQVEEALTFLTDATQSGVLDAEDFRLKLGLLLRGERQTEAQQLLLDQIAITPDNDGQLLTLIGMLRIAGAYDAAIELARGLQTRSRFAEQYSDSLLRIYIDARRYDEAIEMVKEILRDNAPPPEFARGLYDPNQLILIDLLQLSQRYTEAQRLLSGWVAQTQDVEAQSRCWNMLANIHSLQGQTAQAVEAMEKAYEIRPNDPRIANDFGYMLADAGIRLSEAERMIRMAVGSSPRETAYLDSLGWVLYKQGDFQGAHRWLMLACGTGDPEDPVVIDHLGDALWRLGRREEAVEKWRRTVELVERPPGEPLLEIAPPVDNPQSVQTATRAKQKIEAASSGLEPEVAPVAASSSAD